ncbi:hypothetical protein SeLEV6574_g07309 [Synchytrium endobioticum]|uniref:Uncharacterized protein n=1 Tax=Synchytrium endobioticum TaxID=286115 RepID=A0A507CLF2_9FUNG|nr:hypothetical protein SeLEV6574_g08451 [Synchytrium endobioticum]TPX39314.1 hypothetical protein SeLEV6574_g07309 [Synchytrium endobioticum]
MRLVFSIFTVFSNCVVTFNSAASSSPLSVQQDPVSHERRTSDPDGSPQATRDAMASRTSDTTNAGSNGPAPRAPPSQSMTTQASSMPCHLTSTRRYDTTQDEWPMVLFYISRYLQLHTTNICTHCHTKIKCRQVAK